MAGPAPLGELYKATWSGTLGTSEEFVYSRWCTAGPATPEADVATTLLGSITAMLATTVISGPVPSLATAWPSHVAWTQLKISHWDQATNKLVAGSSPHYEPLTDVASGSTGAGMPFQCSLAVTTRSALAGRRKYNRFYLPGPQVFTTDGQGSLQSSVADAISLWLHFDITSAAVAATPVSFVNWNFGAPTERNRIVDTYLGHRIDTIRRRRDELVEGRTIDVL